MNCRTQSIFSSHSDKTREEETPRVYKPRWYDIDALTSSAIPLVNQHSPYQTMNSLGDYENTDPLLMKDMKAISKMGDKIDHTVGINFTMPDNVYETHHTYDVMGFLDKLAPKVPKGKNPGRLYGPKDSLFRREDLVRQKIRLEKQ